MRGYTITSYTQDDERYRAKAMRLRGLLKMSIPEFALHMGFRETAVRAYEKGEQRWPQSVRYLIDRDLAKAERQ